MKRLLLIFLIGVLSSGCSIIERPDFPPDETHIDDELLPYYETFLDEREKMGFTEPLPHITIRLGELNMSWRGVCKWAKELNYGNNHVSQREVVINKKHYDDVMAQDGEGYHKGIEVVLFHELAHCFWQAKHYEKEYPRIVKVYEPETDEYVNYKVMCRDLMHTTGGSYKGSRDYLCYTQHFDLYQEQLHAIMSNKIWR